LKEAHNALTPTGGNRFAPITNREGNESGRKRTINATCLVTARTSQSSSATSCGINGINYFVIRSCPFSGRKHHHGAGAAGEDPHQYATYRVSHYASSAMIPTALNGRASGSIGASTEAALAKGGVMTDHHLGRTAFTTDRSLEFFSDPN
jgi:hypothetical protein